MKIVIDLLFPMPINLQLKTPDLLDGINGIYNRKDDNNNQAKNNGLRRFSAKILLFISNIIPNPQ